MKRYFFIFISFISQLTAQINPPELRCLEVAPNGDVKLSWIPPADPGDFYSYEIYFSPQKNGPFTLLPSSLTSISLTSFVHTTTVTTVQSAYYYMVARSGAGGANSSKHSDTLRTIFLNPFPGLVSLDIRFSNLHLPKLPSSAALYTINKEYPLGSWKVLATTASTLYPDTIDVCSAKINYQISLPDASGCQSTSNLVMGKYNDTKAPEEPYVDSLSILPDGRAVIAWQIPLDRDVDKYVIQYLVNGLNQPIDIVPGRNSTSYTYTSTTANLHSIGLFVQAQDSCKRGSTVNYQLRSMFLQTTYDHCAYQTRLKWNPYTWPDINGRPVESLGEYRIYYSVNGSNFSYAGSTTDTSFTHKGVAPGKNVCYFVRVVNKRATVTASSNRACFFSDQVNAPNYAYIRSASVLDKTSAEIRVHLDNSQSSKGLIIQRSINDTDFVNAGFIPYTGGTEYILKDEQLETSSRSYSYRALIIDSCGNTRSPSNVAKTILLRVHEEESDLFTKRLSWSPYKGFAGGVSGYNIYRMINGDMNNGLAGSTDALTTQFTDNLESAAPLGARIEYIVQAVEGISNPYGILETSNSNPVPVYMEGNLFVPNAFAPGGVNTTWRPVTHFIDKTDYRVSVFNRWGKKVFETSDDTSAWDGEGCIADVYVYLIDYKNSRGEYMQLKGTVMLLR